MILEAQASGLPVLAVGAEGSNELIESGRRAAWWHPIQRRSPMRFGGLARRGAIRDRLATGGLMALRERTWERSLAQLAGAYAHTIAVAGGAPSDSSSVAASASSDPIPLAGGAQGDSIALAGGAQSDSIAPAVGAQGGSIADPGAATAAPRAA